MAEHQEHQNEASLFEAPSVYVGVPHQQSRGQQPNAERLERPKTLCRAIVLFADLMRSCEISNEQSECRYDDFVYSFQETVGMATEAWLAAIRKRNEARGNKGLPFHCAAELRGDELCVKVYREVARAKDQRCCAQPSPGGNDHPDFRRASEYANQTGNDDEVFASDVADVLQLAIQIKRKWLESDENRHRIDDSRPTYDVGIGVNRGTVVLSEHKRFRSTDPALPGENAQPALTSERVPEGYSINLAKRIETKSRELKYSQILVSQSVYRLVDKDLQVAFRREEVSPMKGISSPPAVYEAIGIGHFDDAQWPIELDQKTLILFENATRANPDMVWLLLDLGHYFFDHESYEESAEYYQRVIDTISDFAPAHLYLGRCYFRRYMYEEAERSLERALQLDPRSSRAHRFLAVCYRRRASQYVGVSGTGGAGASDESGKAFDYYRRALELHESAKRCATEGSDGWLWATNGYAHTIAEATAHFQFRNGPYTIEKAREYAESVREICEGRAKRGGAFDKMHLVLGTSALVELRSMRSTKGLSLKEQSTRLTSARDYLNDARSHFERRFNCALSGAQALLLALGRNAVEKAAELLYIDALIAQEENDPENDYRALATKAIHLVEAATVTKPFGVRFASSQYWYQDAKGILAAP